MNKSFRSFLGLLLMGFLCLPCGEVSAQSLNDMLEQILTDPENDNIQEYQQKLNMLEHVETAVKEKLKKHRKLTSQQKEQLERLLTVLDGRRVQLNWGLEDLEEVAARQSDFELNGVYYKKLSASEVAVTYKDEYENGNTYVGDIVLPASVTKDGINYKVTSICAKAFDRCWKLTSLVIPEGVTEIGDFAFSGCVALKSIKIPDSLHKFGMCAFSGCIALSSINIPEGTETISHQCFVGCSSLTSARLPSTVKSIERDAFASCTKLSSVNLPEGLVSIGESAFNDCVSLKDVVLPSTLQSIDDKAFGSTALTKVVMPANVSKIHPDAFANCAGVEIILPDKGYVGTKDGHEWVDLGLPSGLKWATCNVGASSPKELGKYFEWEEVNNKYYYEQNKEDSNPTYVREYKDISGVKGKDVARTHWGGKWRMPTQQECEELIANCSASYVEIDGFVYAKLTSKTNYRSIIFPLAGRKVRACHYDLFVNGRYWSSSPIGCTNIASMGFSSSGAIIGAMGKTPYYEGCCVRPVTE